VEHTDTNMTGNFEVAAPASSPVDLRADAAMDDIRTIRPGARSPLSAGVAAMIWGLGLSTYPAIWVRRREWRYVDAGLAGSSYLRLGPVLQYISDNIGFHHIHRLDARIPNYRLPACHRERPELTPTRTLRLRESFASRHLELWDEAASSYVGYDAAAR